MPWVFRRPPPQTPSQRWIPSAPAAGPTTHFGSSSQTFVFGFASNGVRTRFASSTQGFVFGFVSAGFKKTFGASTTPIVFGFVSNGVIVTGTKQGSSSQTFTFGFSSASKRTTFATSTVPLVFGASTGSFHKTFGVSTTPLAVNFTSNGVVAGEVTPGSVAVQESLVSTVLAEAVGASVSAGNHSGTEATAADSAVTGAATEVHRGSEVAAVDIDP